MKRLTHIDERLERWARWCETGAGRLSIAPWARMRVGNPGASNPDVPLTHDAERETDAMVRQLPAKLQRVVHAWYRRKGTKADVAVALELSRVGLHGQLCLIDRKIQQLLDERRRGADGPKKGKSVRTSFASVVAD